MIQFTIDSFSGGISGRRYKSINEAIQDGGYSVWCNEKIKLAFNFGNVRFDEVLRVFPLLPKAYLNE